MQIYPQAKRVLLTAYADTDAAIRAINSVKIDYYLLNCGIRRMSGFFPAARIAGRLVGCVAYDGGYVAYNHGVAHRLERLVSDYWRW